MPHSPAKMYSGDSATPAITSVRRLPLTSADSRAPGFRPRAMANDSETQTGSAPSGPTRPGDIDASSAWPLRSVSRFMRGGRRRSMPISWPTIGSVTPSISTRTSFSVVVCTSATPGMRAQRFGERIGRALDAGEDVGEAPLGIEAVARERERVDRRQRRDEAADAAGHDERDRQRLAPHQPQVAQQLAVERLHGQPAAGPPRATKGPAALLPLRGDAKRRSRKLGGRHHQLSSDGASLCSLRVMRRMRPSPR